MSECAGTPLWKLVLKQFDDLLVKAGPGSLYLFSRRLTSRLVLLFVQYAWCLCAPHKTLLSGSSD